MASTTAMSCCLSRWFQSCHQTGSRWHVCLPARQRSSTSRPWYHPVAAERDAWLHWSWPLAAQQSRPESRRLQDLGRHAAAGVWITRQQRRWAEATSPRRLAWCAARHHWLGCQPVETATESVRACTRETFWTFVASLCNTNLNWKPIRANKLLLNFAY